MSKKCTPLWREAHFEVKMYKAHHGRTTSDHFWKLSCRKSECRCGAKHISKSKCTKYTILGPLLEVPMWKKCTPLRRQNVQNTRGSDHFGGSDVASLRFTTLHYITLHSTTLHCTTLHYITQHSTPLHCTALRYTTLHNTTATQLHNYTTTLHYTPLH